jgi:hypothetical protein
MRIEVNMVQFPIASSTLIYDLRGVRRADSGVKYSLDVAVRKGTTFL